MKFKQSTKIHLVSQVTTTGLKPSLQKLLQEIQHRENEGGIDSDPVDF